VLALSIVTTQKTDQAEVRLKAAIQKETVERDLKAAIDAYKKLSEGGNRVVAAQALVRMGQCYEKLRNADALRAYERVIRDFNDQK
jgi:TPR repeat protein